MSFSIQPKTLKKLVDFYHPNNKSEEMKYVLFLKGQDEMYMNLETSAFQGISQNSIEERVAWFGSNQVIPPFQFTFMDMVVKSLTQYTCMVWLLVFSVILFTVGIFFQYNHLRISYVEGLVGLVLYLVNSILIAVVEYGKYTNFKNIYSYTSNKNYCDVWRENQKEQIDAEKVVVGDIVELGVGSVIPADGWIIEGELKVEEKYSYGTTQASKTTMKACVNHLERQAKHGTKKYTVANKIKPQDPNVQYSPVVIGGSTVIEGEGRMLVLCVGKFSRKGQFELLLKNFNPYKKNSQLEIKMEEFTSQLFKYGLLGVFILIIGLFVKEVVSNLIDHNQKLSDLLNFQRFEHITLSLNFLLYLIPYGCPLGLSVGLLIHKKFLQYSHQISVKQLTDCQSMSYVEYICHEKQTEKSYFRIREWWNNAGKVNVEEEPVEEDEKLNPKKENEQEERLFKKLNQVNKTYLKFFRKAMTVTSASRDVKNQRVQKSLKFGSFRNLDECFIHYSRRKSYISLDQVNEDQIIEQIPYDNIRKRTVVVTNCPKDIDIQIPKSPSNVLTPPLNLNQPKYRISLKVEGSNKLLPKYEDSVRIQRKFIVYIRGKHETVLEMCSFIMCQQTGKVEEITEQKATEIKSIIDSMLRRQLRAVVLAYKITTRSENYESCQSWDEENGYVLLAIIGINDTRSTLDFQLLMKIKQVNINLMVASTNSMEASVSAANEIGIIKTDESSILINGSDFLHIVGGIICSQCKKPMCVCEHGNQCHRIKNIDEFQRILKHLDVLANAEAFHKYTLIVGLKNKNICSAVTGKKIIDIPSMIQSEVSLYSRESQPENENKSFSQVQQSAFDIEIPDNSVATLFNLIKESRICFKFIRKFVKMATCSCLVSMIYLMTSLILFKEDFGIKLVHIFWVQIVVLFFLALAMIFDYQTDNNEAFPIMNEDIKEYSKGESMINSEGWKQIATYSLTQLIILFSMTLLGPLFIPEKADEFDQVIGEDWMAKYADETRSTICSGIPFAIQGSNWRYKEVFQKYGVFSRHQTVVFALFSMMQILNYFNFRQFNMKEVNIFKNFKIISVLIILVVMGGNLIFIENLGDYAGLYENGLIFEQWVIVFGIAMTLWVVGILARLFPNMKKEENEYKIRWQNKAYNLAVKSVAASNQLSDFEVDEYFELRPEIFQNNKSD